MQYSTISRENLVARHWYRPFGKQLHQYITITSLNSASAGNHYERNQFKGCRGRDKQLLALLCVWEVLESTADQRQSTVTVGFPQYVRPYAEIRYVKQATTSLAHVRIGAKRAC